MFGVKFGFVLSALLLASGVQSQTDVSKLNLNLPVCKLLQLAVSPASLVSLPGSATYDADIAHWASSSSQPANCTVRPSTAKDVAAVVLLAGLTRTPFNVKGGGHASNPGFSSSPGILISMSNFNQVTYDAKTKTASIGPGLIWDDVYDKLAPYNVSVVGGRVSGVGVAGLTLGGGFSWKTNQYGLTVDTITAYELVKPTGAIVTVTQSSDPDLFFGLKGGMNNFGIVTKFTLKAFPQTQVWGGPITIAGDPYIDQVAEAIVQWEANVKDPKAAILPAYNYYQGNQFISLTVFYDAPTPPSGLFDNFTSIPAVSSDVSTRSYLSLVQSTPANQTYGLRGLFNTVSFRSYSPKVLAAIKNETLFWGQALASKTAVLISYDVEPFLSNIFSHSNSPSAYPPTRTFGFSPFDIYYAWVSDAFDKDMQDAVRQSAAQLRSVAISDGQDLTGSGLYPNYAIDSTPVSDIYGANLSKLRALKARVDPLNVMGLAGGFKV